MIGEEAKSAAEIRARLAAALSAAGAAVTGMAETLRQSDEDLQKLVTWADAWAHDELEPLQEEAIEPLCDALSLAIEAAGIIPAHSRIYDALSRYQNGDKD